MLIAVHEAEVLGFDHVIYDKTDTFETCINWFNGIFSYYGFHVDDHPTANISRYFTRTTDFIDDALSRGGVVCVNCVMGWSRSATTVAAYLVTKKGMTSTQAIETIRQNNQS